jgi:hypothetical protein
MKLASLASSYGAQGGDFIASSMDHLHPLPVALSERVSGSPLRCHVTYFPSSKSSLPLHPNFLIRVNRCQDVLEGQGKGCGRGEVGERSTGRHRSEVIMENARRVRPDGQFM